MSSTTLTINQLRLSPFNVRINEEDANNTASMERSLLARGQMMPLLVHPMKGNKRSWAVFAGGRRYRSFKKLIEAGRFPADHPITVVIRDMSESELIEMSLTENDERKDLRPYEKYAAVVRANKLGATVEHIAATIDQPEIEVKRWLRLGSLARPIFEALEHRRLTVDQAKAFGATEDHAAQIAAWDALRGDADTIGAYSAARIRAELGVGDIEDARLLAFVGDQPYRDAGGRYEMDLFADDVEHRGRASDRPLLRQLAEARLEAVRDETRRRAGRAVRFITSPPQGAYNTPDYQLQVNPKPGPDDSILLPEGDVVALLLIKDGGELETSWWWASRKAKHGTEKPARPTSLRVAGAPIGAAMSTSTMHGGDASRRQADAAIKEEDGLSQDSVEIFRSIRKTLFRAALVDDARAGHLFAQDYLIWSQLRMLIDRDAAPRTVGIAMIQQSGPGVQVAEMSREHIGAMPATVVWAEALRELQRRPMLSDPDLAMAYTSFTTETPATKNLAAAVIVGMTLERSLNAADYHLPVHDAIAQRIGLADDAAIRRYWKPTEALLERIPKEHRLAIAEPFVERVAFAPWSRLKSAELTRHVVEVVTAGAAGIRASMAEAARSWVHPLLRFVPAPAAGDAPAPVQEAAE